MWVSEPETTQYAHVCVSDHVSKCQVKDSSSPDLMKVCMSKNTCEVQISFVLICSVLFYFVLLLFVSYFMLKSTFHSFIHITTDKCVS